MEIDFAPSHNPTLFGSLSVSPPASMFDSFSPLLHLNDDFLDVLNTTNDDDDDWMKPLLFDQYFEHELQQNYLSFNDIEIKEEDEKEKLTDCFIRLEDKLILNNSYPHSQRENEFVNFVHQKYSEQQLPSTTIRVIHQPKIEPSELPTTLYVSGNELQIHPIITTNNNTNGKTIGHTYTSK
jgi:hypothetical protein